MLVSTKNRDILRRLAAQVMDIAAMPVQQQTIQLWKGLNGLRPRRPMITIDQIPWHEMNVDNELTLQTDEPFCRRLEEELRMTLYRWKHMRADMVIQPWISIPKVVRNTGYGYHVVEETAVKDPQNSVVGHHYSDQIKTEADIDKIHAPEISIDVKATADAEAKAHAIFDGVAPIYMEGITWICFTPWDIIAQWRGVEDPLYDLADRPEFTHRLLTKLTDAMMSQIDQFEALGLLESPSYIHCTGGWADELPAPGPHAKPPRTKQVWTCGMAQIFSTVSPAMHKEFEVDYAERWYARFGLGYYGCCEPLDGKIDVLRKLPNLRKISMSPWVDQERGARAIGRDFVFSRKPSPAFLAVDKFDPAAVEKDLRQTVDVCKAHGCPLELILKDISTVRYEPQRLWQWEKIARKLVGAE